MSSGRSLGKVQSGTDRQDHFSALGVGHFFADDDLKVGSADPCQARGGGLVAGDLETLRAVIRATQDIRRFEPRLSPAARRG